MSHVTDIRTESLVTSLTALQRAIDEFCPTLEMVAGTRYRVWKTDHGTTQTEYLPQGWHADDVGCRAVRVIRIRRDLLDSGGRLPGYDTAAYEIGVVPVRVVRGADGGVLSTKPVPEEEADAYALMTDWWAQGYGLLHQPGLGAREHELPAGADGRDRDGGRQMADLFMHYQMMVCAETAERRGDRVQFSRREDGSWDARVTQQERLRA